LQQMPGRAVRVDRIIWAVVLGVVFAAVGVAATLGDTLAAEEMCVETPRGILTTADGGIELAIAQSELVVSAMLRVVDDGERDGPT